MHTPTPTLVAICGCCRRTYQAMQAPDFCGHCGVIAGPWLTMRTVVEPGGSGAKARTEHAFVGPWGERARSTWTARLGGE